MSVYLDHAATTPTRPEVLQAMWPYFTSQFGNPSSVHELGFAAADALGRSREVIAGLTGFSPEDVVFTSGGTEADNLAVVGLALANPRGRHIVAARSEHEAVLQSIAWLERIHGFSVSWLELEADGRISAESLSGALRPDSTLLSVMMVNNEIGTVQPIAELATMAHAHGALVHCDAVQAAGWFDLRELGVDALAISGHKLGAPKGIGAALIRSTQPLEPTVWGGGQQLGRRSGTENVAGAVALATAFALAERDRLNGVDQRVALLRDQLIEGVLRIAPSAELTGPRVSTAMPAASSLSERPIPSALVERSERPSTSASPPLGNQMTPGSRAERSAVEGRPRGTQRAPHIASFVFRDVNGESVLLGLEERGVLCSSGSACAAGSTKPSHVLRALGLSESLAHTSVRFSLGPESSQADVEAALSALEATLGSLRA